MKKVLLLIMSLFFCATIMSAQNNGGDPTEIVVRESGNNGGNPSHYAPALVPIQAVVYQSFSTIVVEFLFDLGSISVEIENLTTNSYSQTSLNATQGAHPILFSGDSGIYEITFTLSNGHIYWGTFEIE